MPVSPYEIRLAAQQLCPDIASVIGYDSSVTTSTWQSGLETGKALEILSLCALVSELRTTGNKVWFPDLFLEKPDLFYLRNVLPRHHGAQAGHEGAADENLPLHDRFIAALTAKVVVELSTGIRLGVYREGCPIHLMQALAMRHAEYLDRPDILIVDGTIEIKSGHSLSELDFSYTSQSGHIYGVLRIKNDIAVPLKSYSTDLNENVIVRGLVECSVGKGNDLAEDQLVRYRRIFCNQQRFVSVLVNGRKKSCPAYDYQANVNLTNGDVNSVVNSICSGMRDLVLAL